MQLIGEKTRPPCELLVRRLTWPAYLKSQSNSTELPHATLVVSCRKLKVGGITGEVVLKNETHRRVEGRARGYQQLNVCADTLTHDKKKVQLHLEPNRRLVRLPTIIDVEEHCVVCGAFDQAGIFRGMGLG